ncbi:MAG: phage portal protein [Eubacteriales bacterium]|nr:phage portal protein [Eubacteriales bacterium]MDD4390310.1 phage portal protein [Eubacteriales bacterium]
MGLIKEVRTTKNPLKKFFQKDEVNKDLTLQGLINMLNLRGVSGEALSEATYFACLKILSESLGKLPLKLQQHTQDGGVVKAYRHPLYSVLSTRPNPYMTSTHFWSTVEYNRNHHGNAYVWIRGAGSRTTLWILPSNAVQIWVDDKGVWGSQNSIWYAYTHQKSGEIYKISSDSILHFKTSTSFDGIKGLSVRDILDSTLAGNLTAQDMLNKLYENGFTAKAVLQYTGSLSDELTKKFVKGIEDFATGNNDTVKSIIPIPLGATLTPLNIKLADNQFVELKKYSALQIAAAFGIKPNQINDYEKASYAAAEQQQLAFYVDTLLYILKQYEEELSYKLLTEDELQSGYYFKFNVAVILRADLKTQIESLVSATTNGLYTPDEARALLDYPAKGCNELICNGNMMPVKMAGEQFKKGGNE